MNGAVVLLGLLAVIVLSLRRTRTADDQAVVKPDLTTIA